MATILLLLVGPTGPSFSPRIFDRTFFGDFFGGIKRRRRECRNIRTAGNETWRVNIVQGVLIQSRQGVTTPEDRRPTTTSASNLSTGGSITHLSSWQIRRISWFRDLASKFVAFREHLDDLEDLRPPMWNPGLVSEEGSSFILFCNVLIIVGYFCLSAYSEAFVS